MRRSCSRSVAGDLLISGIVFLRISFPAVAGRPAAGPAVERPGSIDESGIELPERTGARLSPICYPDDDCARRFGLYPELIRSCHPNFRLLFARVDVCTAAGQRVAAPLRLLLDKIPWTNMFRWLPVVLSLCMAGPASSAVVVRVLL